MTLGYTEVGKTLHLVDPTHVPAPVVGWYRALCGERLTRRTVSVPDRFKSKVTVCKRCEKLL